MNQLQERSWWSRNWKWFVPVGCLGVIVLFVSFSAVAAYLIFGFVKSSETYQQAVAKAKTNSAVIEALGSPIEEGFLVAGNIKTSGASGEAELAIPISGPKDRAILYAVATKSAGRWTFSTLELAIKSSDERIDILFSDTDASQTSSEMAIEEFVSKIYLGMVYPSRNVYLKSFNSSLNWSRSVLIHPLPIEGKYKPPIENNFNKAVFIQEIENEYIPGFEGFDESHNKYCGWEYDKPKAEADGHIPDFFETVLDYCEYEEGVLQ